MADDARYDDRETALILRMAAELDHGGPPGPGQSLREIEQIAVEAGIRPESVRRAAAALAAELDSGGSSFMGGPTTFRYERLVTGRLSSVDVQELVQTIRWESGKQGEVTDIPDGIAWEHSTEEGPLLRVELSDRGDATRIRLLGRYEDPAGWTAIAGGVGAVGAAIASTAVLEGSAALFFGSLAGYTTVAWWGVRLAWRRISTRVEARLSHLVEHVTERAQALAETRPAAGTLAGTRSAAAPPGSETRPRRDSSGEGTTVPPAAGGTSGNATTRDG